LGVAGDPNREGFFRVLWSALRQIGDAHLVTVSVALASIGILLFVAKAYPKVPGPLVVTVLGTAAAAFGGLPSLGAKLIPELPQGIPLPGLPSLHHVPELAPGALAIALMAFLETVSAARGIRRREDPQIDPNRELTATGLAAVASSFFHALPPSGGFSQSQVNTRSGARTQVSSLVTATLAVVVALFLAPVLSKLPEATLGAMVLVPVLGLVNVQALRQLYAFDRLEFLLAVIVALFGLTVGLLPAVAVGVLLTLYSVLHEANQPHVVEVVAVDGRWVDGAEGVLSTPAIRWFCHTDPAVHREPARQRTRGAPTGRRVRSATKDVGARPVPAVEGEHDDPQRPTGPRGRSGYRRRRRVVRRPSRFGAGDGAALGVVAGRRKVRAPLRERRRRNYLAGLTITVAKCAGSQAFSVATY
jgi:MFS superfamily sulfate permease-like transporter